MFFDAAVCWGFPILYMALRAYSRRAEEPSWLTAITDYIVQGHRFDILEDFGCRPTVYVSLPAIFLVWVPPMTAALATFGFAGTIPEFQTQSRGLMTLLAMALKNFFHRRLTFAAHLQNYSTGLTTSRYLRLMSMSVVQMIWTVLVTSLNIWFSCQHGLRLWISWQNVHSDFSQIAYFPTALIPRESLRWTYALWWAVPFSALLFVVFFASGEEAMNEYRNILRWIHSLIFPQFGTKIEAPLTRYSFNSTPFIFPLTVALHSSAPANHRRSPTIPKIPQIFAHFPSPVLTERMVRVSYQVMRPMFFPNIQHLVALLKEISSQVHLQARTNNGGTEASVMRSNCISLYLQLLIIPCPSLTL